MEVLAFTADKMSWAFLLSAIRRIQADEGRVPSVDLNLEAPSCVVLSCIAVEAFVNEVSSLTDAFLFDKKRDALPRRSTEAQKRQVAFETLHKIASLRRDTHGSFYVRYKRLLRDMSIEKPDFLTDLSKLRKLRNALVHFRECDVPIIEDQDGVIREGQDLPTELTALQTRRYEGRPLVAPGQGTAWSVRMATDAMAVWSVNLALDATIYVLEHLPAGRHRDFLWKAYASRDRAFGTVFASGKNDLATWWKTVVQTNRDEAL